MVEKEMYLLGVRTRSRASPPQEECADFGVGVVSAKLSVSCKLRHVKGLNRAGEKGGEWGTLESKGGHIRRGQPVQYCARAHSGCVGQLTSCGWISQFLQKKLEIQSDV